MPVVIPPHTTVVYRRATDIPQSILRLVERDARNANIILPTILKRRANEQAGRSSADNLWIVSSSANASGERDVDFVTAVTEGVIDSYPIFIYHARPLHSLTHEFLEPRMKELCESLLDAGVPTERVFSVFATEPVTRAFASAWTSRTGVQVNPGDEKMSCEYYSALLTYCDSESFGKNVSKIPRLNSPFEVRVANMNDLAAVASHCFEFAALSEPFTLTRTQATDEARSYIEKGQLWVHTITDAAGVTGLASICAVTRTTSTVAGITKVYTNPQYRKMGCALRLVHAVCEHYLKYQGKTSLVLYVAHDNQGARRVYHQAGFRGLDGQPCSGVEPWLEIGFDRRMTRLGHW